ncbi:MAG TPA: phosphoribosylanthranilate isomerase [Gammaproteobacteria bacterium]|nr:phosphoribosylanthranilate isomerase [Gammaproteobacteria bacterium]
MAGIIQVAGVMDRAEAALLVDAGVDWLGFPFRLAYHAEDLAEAEAGAIAALCDRLGVWGVQLHGAVAAAELARLRRLRPGLHVLKSLIVRPGTPAGELEAAVAASAPWVDGYLTDTLDPATGATGATGLAHDWAVDRRLVTAAPHPVILAGGLRPDNVRAAIAAVGPAGVDVHTGIEGPDGRKDPERTRRFVAEARAGFALATGP